MGKIYELLEAAKIALPPRASFCEALAEASESRYQVAVAEQRGLEIGTVLADFFAERHIHVEDGLLQASVDAYCGAGSVESLAPLRCGAREVLDTLRRMGLRLGVISNTLQPGHYMDRSLAARGMLGCFGARTYSSDVGVAKPHPEIFAAALRALDVSPQRAVHVGDRLLADVSGAQGAGMKGVLIRVPQRQESSAKIVPDACIDELPELPDVLGRLGS
jgi:putative hydrolase of the HAD superfamily